MKAVQIGSVVLGTGTPKIAVPVMGKSIEELEEAARRAEDADILELRMDSLSPEMNPAILRKACEAVRKIGKPVLATMRTKRDGGAGEEDSEKYEALLDALILEKCCDAVDVELSVGESAFLRIAEAAHAQGIPVIGSFHDFAGTPETEKMVSLMKKMAALNADVCKIAVMPHSRADTAALIAACAQIHDELSQPVIAIAMGELGAMTRLCGEMMGSCLTFGTAGKASAPGQIDARTLRKTLNALHEALTAGAL